MPIVTFVDLVKDFAVVIVSVAVFFATRSFNKWQEKLAKQQLRTKLYDRRLSVYLLFRELLLALPEKSKDEIEAVYKRARLALLEVPFLFEDGSDLHDYLEKVCIRVANEIINNTLDMTPQPADILFDHGNQRAEEVKERKRHYDATKVAMKDEFLTQLPEKFGVFLMLTDFSGRKNHQDSIA